MPKISQYPDGVALKSSDKLVVSRAGVNKSILGSAVGDGWIGVSDAWTYASATTINIPSDGTLIYQKGDFIRWKQGGSYKYAVIKIVAATLLTLVPSSDYSVANSPITDIAYSRQESPFGWPGWFNLSALTWSGIDNGSGGAPTTSEIRYKISGKKIECHTKFSGYKVLLGNSISFLASGFPVTNINSTERTVGGIAYWSDLAGNDYVGILVAIGASYFLIWPGNIADNTNMASVSFFAQLEW